MWALEAEVRNLSDMRRDLSQDLSRLEGELRTQRERRGGHQGDPEQHDGQGGLDCRAQ